MRSLRRQAGFSLLLYVLMIMGMGGVLLEGYLQNARSEAESQKENHDKKVLYQAKAALLQYAFNYPFLPGTNGPGRLPCSDVDNDGSENTDFGDCDSIGRFPFNQAELNTPEFRDSAGERLWYVPASTYMRLTGGAVNSDTTGTITIKDQSGKTIYDGSSEGVAAVIVAPGPAISRGGALQNRVPTNLADDPFDLVADTDAAVISPLNYLDLNGAQDNASLVHLDSDDGFQLGPVEGVTNNILINDRIAIITSEEINKVAEKSVLQIYSESITKWQLRIWGGSSAEYRFPWLDGYSSDPLSDPISSPAVKAITLGQPLIGRVPIVNGKYFFANRKPSGTPYNTDQIGGDIKLKYSVDTNPPIEISQDLPGSMLNAVFKGSHIELDAAISIPVSLSVISFYIVSDWPVGVASIWQLCPEVLSSISDCSRNNAGDFTPGLPNQKHSLVKHITINLIPGDHNVVISSVPSPSDFSSDPVITNIEPPSSMMDAMIYPELSATGELKIKSLVSTALYDTYDFKQYPQPTTQIASNDTINIIGSKLGISYYPEMPFWLSPNEDRWRDSVLLAYSKQKAPGGSGVCTPGVDCLSVANVFSGRDVGAVLINAGESSLGLSLQSELLNLFDPENRDLDFLFDAASINGNDSLMVLQ